MLRELVNDLKRGPCTDCGVWFPPYVKDFDHVRGKKVANLARLRTIRALAKILAEVKKCEVVCANCHRLRTHVRLKGFEVKPSEVLRFLGPNYVSVPVY